MARAGAPPANNSKSLATSFAPNFDIYYHYYYYYYYYYYLAFLFLYFSFFQSHFLGMFHQEKINHLLTIPALNFPSLPPSSSSLPPSLPLLPSPSPSSASSSCFFFCSPVNSILLQSFTYPGQLAPLIIMAADSLPPCLPPSHLPHSDDLYSGMNPKKTNGWMRSLSWIYLHESFPFPPPPPPA